MKRLIRNWLIGHGIDAREYTWMQILWGKDLIGLWTLPAIVFMLVLMYFAW